MARVVMVGKFVYDADGPALPVPIHTQSHQLPFTITTLANCKSSNLVYQLQCKKCEAFYIVETGQMLSKRVNGHFSTYTVTNSDLPVPIHTQSPQIPFQECWSVRVIHKLRDTTPDHVHCQHEMAYQLILKSRQFPGINIR